MIDLMSVVFRDVTLACVALCLPINLFTMFIIVKKSPTQLGVYKYVMLKISIWVFLTDIIMDLFIIPAPTPTRTIAVYLTGLSSAISPFAGTVSCALCIVCVTESFTGLCIAFFFRYQSLSHNFRLFGWQPDTIYYRFVVAVVVVVFPGAQFFAAIYALYPREDFNRMVLDENAELGEMLGNSLVFGPQKKGIMVVGAALSAHILLAVIFMVLCILGIMKQLRALRPSMSAATYAMQIQLVKSLIVQTATPLILFATPMCAVTLDLVFNFGCLRYGAMIMVLSMSAHSVVNSSAVILLIVPYRKAVLEIFCRKKSVTVIVSVTATA